MRDHEGDDREGPQAHARHQRGRRRRRRRRHRRVRLSAARALKAGDQFGPSRWIEVGQERIDGFAAVTDDAEWIQANRRRVAEGRDGSAIVPGFLTLSLLAGLWFEVTEPEGHRVTLNYGLNRVRFPAPLPVGGRVRASFRVDELTPAADGEQALITATVEGEGMDRPVCVAELVFRFLS